MIPETIPRFSDAMALHQVDGCAGEFAGFLNEHWTIGPKVHGGVMVALCAKAAREAYGSTAHPVAVSANFLSAPDPGEVRLIATVRKRGRRVGLVDVELIQGDRGKTSGSKICVHAVVTLGEPEHQGQPLFAHSGVTELMTVEPPAEALSIGPGHPAADINHLARGCDIRPLMVEELATGEAPMFRIWVRPRDGAVDELFALMCGDISLPVPYAVGRRGWAPTVQLTAYLRALPTDGWLRVMCTATQIGQDWFDEDHTVVDSAGRIVVQTRQLALVPAG
jgi:hypothetical protein